MFSKGPFKTDGFTLFISAEYSNLMDEHNVASERTLDDTSFMDETMDGSETASQTTTEAGPSGAGDLSEWDTADDEFGSDGFEPPTKRK